MNDVNSPLISLAMSKIVAIGHGYKGPSYAMCVNGDVKKSISLIIDCYRKKLVDIGCTIMSDGWRDLRQ